MGPENEQGPGNERGRRAEQFLHFGNYTLTPEWTKNETVGIRGDTCPSAVGDATVCVRLKLLYTLYVSERLVVWCSVVEVLTQLNQVQRPRSHHRPSSLQLLGIASKSSTKPLHHANASSKSESRKSIIDRYNTLNRL